MELINYKENLQNHCIYKIGFKNYQYFYIGSTSQLRKRKECHLRNLLRRTHTSPRLQNCFNKYQKDCYFEVVETTEKDKLFDLEQKYIDDNKEFLLNCCFVAGQPPGPKDYKKVSESVKKAYFDKNYCRYLKIKTLIECGKELLDIVKLMNCSTKTVVKVKKMFNLEYDTCKTPLKTIKTIKRYFRRFNKPPKENRKQISKIYKKLSVRLKCETSVIRDISRGRIYKNVKI